MCLPEPGKDKPTPFDAPEKMVATRTPQKAKKHKKATILAISAKTTKLFQNFHEKKLRREYAL